MKILGSGMSPMPLLALFLLVMSPLAWADDIEIDLGGNAATQSAPKATAAKPTAAPSKAEKAPVASSPAKTLNPVIDKIAFPKDQDGMVVKIVGKNLNDPELQTISKTKVLLKFEGTELQVPAKTKGPKDLVKEVRTSLHGKTAWVVVEGPAVQDLTLDKKEDGFALIKKTGDPVVVQPSSSAVKNASPEKEKSLFLRLVDASLRPQSTGIKLVLTADGPSKYTVRKLTQPDKLVIHLQDTRLELQEKNRTFKSGDPELSKGGLLSLEYRQLGQAYSPLSEVLLTLLPGTTYQVDRDLNQIVVSLSAPPVETKNLENKGNMNKLITLDVESADLNAVLKTMVAEAGFEVNFVSGPVSGVVTQRFRDVPFKSVMADLLAPGNYGYDLQGNTIRIGPQANLKLTKAILPHMTDIISPSGGMTPDSLDQMVRKVLPTSNAVTTVFDTNRNVLILNGTASDIEEYKKALKDLKLDSEANSDRITRVVKLNYADPDDLQKIIEVYKTPLGKIQADKANQRLVIWETAANMGVLLELIKELDTKPAQVLIESSIVEVDDENDLSLGVSWNVNRNIGDPTVGGNTQTLPSSAIAGVLTFGTVRSGMNINATLEAIVSKKKGKIVSRPRVATQSGTPAEIQETENVIVETQTQTNVPNVGVQIVTNFTQVGLPIDLKVTPRITDDGRITTDINASITSQTGPAPPNGPPPTNVQQATTKLTTKNGETIVIGGLVREVASDTVTGVPLLSSLPILGSLFQDHEKTVRKEELIIFITPTLLED